MRPFAPILSALLLLTCLTGCSAWRGASSPGQGERVAQLLDWMTGDFDNADSLTDPAREAIEKHLPVQVHLRALPAIPNALYIEQAMMASPSKPYRQRVYMLREAGGQIIIEFWTLADPEAFANAHLQPGRLAALDASMLHHREGCDVFLNWTGSHFEGGTAGTECTSSVRGASYVTSRVSVHEWGFESLDQGFTADGEQAWGASGLPYRFTKRR